MHAIGYHFKFIQVPNRYWKEPVGYTSARRTGISGPSTTAPGLCSRAPMDRRSGTDARQQILSPHGPLAVRPSLAFARENDHVWGHSPDTTGYGAFGPG